MPAALAADRRLVDRRLPVASTPAAGVSTDQ
jgi:hypothetical protein